MGATMVGLIWGSLTMIAAADELDSLQRALEVQYAIDSCPGSRSRRPHAIGE